MFHWEKQLSNSRTSNFLNPHLKPVVLDVWRLQASCPPCSASLHLSVLISPSIYHIPLFDQCQGARAAGGPRRSLFVRKCVFASAPPRLRAALSCVRFARGPDRPPRFDLPRSAFEPERTGGWCWSGEGRFGMIRLKSPALLQQQADGLCQSDVL